MSKSEILTIELTRSEIQAVCVALADFALAKEKLSKEELDAADVVRRYGDGTIDDELLAIECEQSAKRAMQLAAKYWGICDQFTEALGW